MSLFAADALGDNSITNDLNEDILCTENRQGIKASTIRGKNKKKSRSTLHFQSCQTATPFQNSRLPLSRIKRIIKLDKNVKMVSSELLLGVSEACRLLIRDLTRDSLIKSNNMNRKGIQRADIISAILSDPNHYDFLYTISDANANVEGILNFDRKNDLPRDLAEIEILLGLKDVQSLPSVAKRDSHLQWSDVVENANLNANLSNSSKEFWGNNKFVNKETPSDSTKGIASTINDKNEYLSLLTPSNKKRADQKSQILCRKRPKKIISAIDETINELKTPDLFSEREDPFFRIPRHASSTTESLLHDEKFEIIEPSLLAPMNDFDYDILDEKLYDEMFVVVP